jgi:hypothetical protein
MIWQRPICGSISQVSTVSRLYNLKLSNAAMKLLANEMNFFSREFLRREPPNSQATPQGTNTTGPCQPVYKIQCCRHYQILELSSNRREDSADDFHPNPMMLYAEAQEFFLSHSFPRRPLVYRGRKIETEMLHHCPDQGLQ